MRGLAGRNKPAAGGWGGHDIYFRREVAGRAGQGRAGQGGEVDVEVDVGLRL